MTEMEKLDFENILHYAMRSQLAYSVSELGWHITKILKWQTPNLSLSLHIKDLPDTEINAIVEIDEQNQCQWIAIRGSSNLKNWILDLDYIEHRFQSENRKDDPLIANFHTGFYQGAMSIYKAILPELKQNYATHVTGHSLGGAIAAILMILLHHQDYPIAQCITFGQPKITNKIGAKEFDNLPLLRVINQQDVVPSLPPSTLLNTVEGGYEHFSPEIILQDGNYDYHPEHQPLSTADSFWSHLLKTVSESDLKTLPQNIDDHYLSNYLLNLLSNLQTPDLDLERILKVSA